MIKSTLLVLNIILFFPIFYCSISMAKGKIVQEIIKLPSLEGNL